MPSDDSPEPFVSSSHLVLGSEYGFNRPDLSFCFERERNDLFGGFAQFLGKVTLCKSVFDGLISVSAE